MKTAFVVGMALSGVASAKLLAKNGYKLILYDSRPEIEGLREAMGDIPYENALGTDPMLWLDAADLIVVSPGVPMFLPFIEAAKEKNIEVIGEIELGFRYAQGAFFCITGTNGKTTCTALTGEILKRANPRTFVLGNIGVPITQCAEQTRPGDFIVAETAALQLEGNKDFHAHVAAVTNISEDHMDRFKTMAYYTDVKSKIFLNQTEADYAVLNYDHKPTRALASRTKAEVLYFSRRQTVENGTYIENGEMWGCFRGERRFLLPVEEIQIPGLHNLENALLCAAIGLCAGVGPETIRAALKAFAGVEHRIEFVCEKRGVRYINDSKGTNPDSTIMAIAALQGPVVLLLGGYNKHNTFSELFRAIKKSGKIKHTVILGETAQKLLDAAKEAGYPNVHHCEKGFQNAVDMAAELAEPGDSVLLSPACASWDMFENFEQRGRVFKEIVRAYAD